MSALSHRIAAEHRYDDGTRKCRCGVVMYIGEGSNITEIGPHAYGRHLADVTERAVRDTVAESIEADMNHDANRNATLATAARIAREGTTP